MEIIGWSALLTILGGILIYLSRDQPFPEVSQKHGFFLIAIAGILLIASASPRQFDDARVAATIVTVIAGIQMVIGAWYMTLANRDVIVGPITGILLCIGTGSLFASDWDLSSNAEQATAFITLALMIMLEMYLFFRGMIVGTSAKMWSAAGLRQTERGLLEGERGAIGCFERAWDVEEEYISAMSHLALIKIHNHLGNNEAAELHHVKLQQLGGEEAIDTNWSDALDSSLYHLIGAKSEE